MRFDDSLATVLAGDATTGLGASSAWRQIVDLVARGRAAVDPAVLARLEQLRASVPVEARAASARSLAFMAPPIALVSFFADDVLPVAAPVLRTATLDPDEWLSLLPRLTPATRAVLRLRRDLPEEALRGLASFGTTDFVLADDRSPDVSAATTSPQAVDAADDLPRATEPQGFAIADLVKRIDAFQAARADGTVAPAPASPPERWAFSTDRHGIVRWTDAPVRTALIGLSLGRGGQQGLAEVDAGTAHALVDRRPVRDGVLSLVGGSVLAGQWCVSAVPTFDSATGRFDGYAGDCRRAPGSEPLRERSDSMRQLAHELRTPANAIAGFAELIESQLFGPVHAGYRGQAGAIREQAAALLAAIDDLELSARLADGSLELRPVAVDLAAAVERVGVLVDGGEAMIARADERATHHLLSRVAALFEDEGTAPARARAVPEVDAAALRWRSAGGTLARHLLLGRDFTRRLVEQLAAAMGGSLKAELDGLTLRLPRALDQAMDQAITAQA